MCAATMAGAVWYSLKFNQGRLVYPMDFGSYVFNYKDLPMILVCAMVIIYIAFVCLTAFANAVKNSKNSEKSYTRKINPKLGFLGFLAFWVFWNF